MDVVVRETGMRSIFAGRSARTLLIGTAAAIIAAGAGVTMNTWASFTASASVSQAAVSSSTLSLSVGSPGVTNRLTLGAAGILPGDTLQRVLDLTNAGADLASVTLTTTAPTSSSLDTDGTNGLQLTIDKCTLPWLEAGVSPAFTYTCLGVTSTVLASRAVIGSSLSLANLGSTTAGATDHLRLTLSLPGTAGNALQGATSAITYTFAGTQRAGTNQ